MRPGDYPEGEETKNGRTLSLKFIFVEKKKTISDNDDTSVCGRLIACLSKEWHLQFRIGRECKIAMRV